VRYTPTGPDVSRYAFYVLVEGLLVVISDVRPVRRWWASDNLAYGFIERGRWPRQNGAGVVVAGDEIGTKVNRLDREHQGNGHIVMKGLDGLAGQVG
jgi:hypothetical protein